MSTVDEESLTAAFPVLLKSCALLVDRLDRQLQETVGIQLTWYEVLAQLSSNPQGRMPMKRLAESVMLSKSGITRLIDRMERAGLVERCACVEDGRVCYAGMTRRGAAVISAARPIAAQGIQENFTRHLTTEEAQVMTRALRRVLGEAGGSPPGRVHYMDAGRAPISVNESG